MSICNCHSWGPSEQRAGFLQLRDQRLLAQVAVHGADQTDHFRFGPVRGMDELPKPAGLHSATIVPRQEFQCPPAPGLLGLGETEGRGADCDKRANPVRVFEGEIQRQVTDHGKRD
jgi:hypothetical protein